MSHRPAGIQWQIKNDFIYFFESALTPNTFWVHFKDIDFGDHGKVMELELGKNQSNTYAGNAVKYFQTTTPFKFLGVAK